MWRPVLDGDDAARVRAVVAAIGDEVAAAADTEPSLSGGYAGRALFHGYRCLDGDAASEARAFDALARALEHVMTQPVPWLYYGFTGIAWATHHLRGVVGDAEVLEDLDGLVGEVLAADRWDHAVELGVGALGLAVYALERDPLGDAALARVVDHVEACCERTEHGIAWRSHDDFLGRPPPGTGHYNLGLLHGQAGAIAGLAEICARGGALRDRAEPMLRGAVGWLRAREDAEPGGPLRFPMMIGGEVKGPWKADGWCYGELAIAVALVRAGQALGEARWRDAGHALARIAASRTAEELEGHRFSVDLTLCHGSISRAHLLNRLGQSLGDGALLDAARTWYRVALAGAEDAARRRALSLGFQVGAAGLGLGLLAACSSVEPAWDRAMLVALPPAS
jgi:hypothetical protein